VPSEDARRELVAATRRLDPGAVVDRMQVARGLPAGVAFAASARFGVDAVARLTRGRASLEGARLSVEGGSPARDVLADLERTLRGETPAGLSLGAVTLSPVPASPYTFSARRGSAGLELTGYVPSAGDRAALREAAQRRFLGDPILDKLHLADGAPPDFPAVARLSLEWLAELAEGEARLVDERLTLEGQSLYDGITARTLERLRSGLPSGWVGQASLRTRPAERLLEASLCEDLAADVLKREPLQFQADSPALSEPGRRSLDKVVALTRRCGPMRLAVRVAAEPGPDAAASLALASRAPRRSSTSSNPRLRTCARQARPTGREPAAPLPPPSSISGFCGERAPLLRERVPVRPRGHPGGGIVAGAVGRRPSRSSAVSAFALAGIAALALAGADILRWPEGRAGLIAEITLLALGAFTLGAGLGVTLRRLARRRPAPPLPVVAPAAVAPPEPT
jgi:hypothetical protein